MGEVQLGSSDPFRRFLIGIAPLFAGLICMIVLTNLWLYFWPQLHYYWQQTVVTVIIGYLIYAISNSMFLSKKDMEGAWMVYIVTGIIIFSIYIIGIRVEITGQILFLLRQTTQLLAKLLGVVIGINLIILFIYGLLLHTILKV